MNSKKEKGSHFRSSFGFLALSSWIGTAVHANTIVLVSGTWHGTGEFEIIAPQLEATGHEAIENDLPGYGLRYLAAAGSRERQYKPFSISDKPR